MAAAVAPDGHVLVVDRSAKGVAATRAACAEEIAAGRLSVLLSAVEDLRLPDGVAPFDLAVACRVGVLDGRHPSGYAAALTQVRDALRPGGRLFVDTGSPLTEVTLGAD